MSNEIYLMTTVEADAIAALAQIDANCGFPSAYAQTSREIFKAYQQDIWFISNIKETEKVDFDVFLTRDEILAGVTSLTPSNGDPSWWNNED